MIANKNFEKCFKMTKKCDIIKKSKGKNPQNSDTLQNIILYRQNL